MAQAESPATRPASGRSSSPPPICAICLGGCSNKCFSDSCMHQFCFKCLLEWSKVKAECPLCKAPFTSIIHNVKSNSEYDEHILPVQMDDGPNRAGQYNVPFLHIAPTPPRHQFHFRTTFTVDQGGELAIQQMLLSHPLTTHYLPPGDAGRYGGGRSSATASTSAAGGSARRRDISATSYRRHIYARDLWVIAPPDVTGRYRNTSPQFYRENPAARQRLVPWLNRELNALLMENTQQVMHLVDVIMEYLLTCNIRGYAFRNMLLEHLGNKTDHFIHEFYNFMRSPFDMIGYDRCVSYGRPGSPPINVLSDYENDSDVTLVGYSMVNPNTLQRPVFEVIEIDSDSSHDSDVIIQEPAPPVVVDLVDTTDDDEPRAVATPPPVDRTFDNGDTTSASSIQQEEERETPPNNPARREPLLPLKIRLKHKRQSREKTSSSSRKRRRCVSTCSSSTTSSSSSSSSSESDSESGSCSCGTICEPRRHKKRKHKKFYSFKHYKAKMRMKSQRRNDSSDSDDHLPLSKLKCKKQKKSRKDKQLPKKERESSPESPKALDRERYSRSIEECDEKGCSLSDHCPQYVPSVLSKVVKKNGDYHNGAGPSGARNNVKIKVERVWGKYESDGYSSD